jgi:rare lipoprotein A (peptidoglycan hydrolase)
MKTQTKKKLKKQLKSTRKLLTKKKLLKRKAAARLTHAVFMLLFLLSSATLVFAIATTKPQAPLVIKTNLDSTVPPAKSQPVPVMPAGIDQVGKASWYALGLPAPDALTCASTRFPRGSYLWVRNVSNGKTVVCLVNDYGPQPFTKRVIDLSRGSFRTIESLGKGVTGVEIRLVPAPPSSISLPQALVGYGLCYQKFDPKYCDLNRQNSELK